MANTVINETIANGQIYQSGWYGTGLANAYAFRAQDYVLEFGTANNRYVDVFNVQLATYSSAQATLYFYDYNSPDRIEIYQNGTLIASSANATTLTATDKAFVTGSKMGEFFNDSPDLYLKDFTLTTINGVSYASYAGKITWTHNPAQGSSYTIRTSKGDGSFDWRYILEYPVDGNTIGCPPTPRVNPSIYVPPPVIIQAPSGDGGGCGCKIVCTAMNDAYKFGRFRQLLWLQAASNLSPTHERGYHYLFLPLVKWIYYTEGDNPIKQSTKYLLENVVRRRTADIWAQKRGKRDPLGRAYRFIFEPICWLAGKLAGGK